MSTTIDGNMENVRIVWFDPGETSRAQTNFINRLREIVNIVDFQPNEELSLRSIQSVENESIILIISGSCASSFIPKVEQLKQVDSIFIFCFKSGDYQSLKDRFRKVVEIFVDFQRLWESIRERATFLDQFAQNLAILDHYHASTEDLTEQSVQFLWFQLAKDLILRLPYRPDAKSEMIRFCRQYYQDNPFELSKIKSFEETYEPQSILKWYTAESFVYKMINKALRSQDIDQLHRFAFLISDLSNRLAEEHRKQRTATPFIVYRGAKLGRGEVDRLTRSVRQLICANGFWSTSRNAGRAISFARRPMSISDLVDVVFEIECTSDNRDGQVVCVDLNQFSSHPREQEVLFDLGSCFQIDSCQQEGNLCRIKLKAVHDALSVTSAYFQEKRHELQNGCVEFCLGILYTDLGRYQQAKKYFERILEAASAEDRVWIELHLGRMEFYHSRIDRARKHYDRAYALLINANPPRIQDSAIVLDSIAIALQSEGLLDEALEKHQQVLKIRRQYLKPDHIDIRRSLINIGSAQSQLGKYDQALDSYRQALQLHDAHPPLILPEKAMCLNNIGNVQADLGHFAAALLSYQQAMDVRKKIFPDDHPQIADSLLNIGSVQREQGNYDIALQLCQRALNIRVKLFSVTHPLVADCRYNMAEVYLCQDDDVKALESHQQALRIRQKYLASTHLDIAHSLNAIGACLRKQKKFAEALQHCQSALEIYRKNPLSKEQDRAASLQLIGIIHRRQGDLTLAQNDFQQVLDIRQRCLPPNHPDTANTLTNLGAVAEEMDKCDEALRLYSQALEIQEKSLGADHPRIALSCRNMAHLHWRLHKFDEALRFYQRCLAIDQKNCPCQDESIIGDDQFYIATVYEQMKQNEEALMHYNQALFIFEKRTPQDDPRRLKIELAIDRLSAQTSVVLVSHVES